MLSVEAFQLRLALVAPIGVATRLPGRVGATVSAGVPGVPTVTVDVFPQDAMSDAVVSNSSKRMKRDMWTLSQTRPGAANLERRAF